MDKNEIARRLQQALTEYEGTRYRATKVNDLKSIVALFDKAGHDLANCIGSIIMDIDADVWRERNEAEERERMTPVAPHWPIYPKSDPYRGGWTPVADSSHNSLDGE